MSGCRPARCSRARSASAFVLVRDSRGPQGGHTFVSLIGNISDASGRDAEAPSHGEDDREDAWVPSEIPLDRARRKALARASIASRVAGGRDFRFRDGV